MVWCVCVKFVYVVVVGLHYLEDNPFSLGRYASGLQRMWTLLRGHNASHRHGMQPRPKLVWKTTNPKSGDQECLEHRVAAGNPGVKVLNQVGLALALANRADAVLDAWPEMYARLNAHGMDGHHCCNSLACVQQLAMLLRLLEGLSH